MLTLASAGKSLEQIDEIFGDVQKRHDEEFHPATEKHGVEIVEAAK